MASTTAEAIRNGVAKAARLHEQLGSQTAMVAQLGSIDVFETISQLDIALLLRPLNGLLGAYLREPLLYRRLFDRWFPGLFGAADRHISRIVWSFSAQWSACWVSDGRKRCCGQGPNSSTHCCSGRLAVGWFPRVVPPQTPRCARREPVRVPRWGCCGWRRAVALPALSHRLKKYTNQLM